MSAVRSIAVFAIACATLGNAPWQPTPPPLKAKKESSASSGVVMLAAPIDGMALIKAATYDVGSDNKEQRWAIDLCRTDPLGAACKLDQFSAEGRIDEIEDTPLGGELRISPGTVVATVGAFWIDRTEVTVGAYRRCVQVGDCRAPGYDAGDPKHDRDDLPVTMISWDDAKSFCTFVAKRLPTEDEWELAARGTNERRYPWGMLANPKLCNHGVLDIGAEIVPDDGRYMHPGRILLGIADDVDGFAGLAPVGSFPEGATPDGIVDLAGNAAEWVEDVWTEAHVPEGEKESDKIAGATPSSAYHIARGGSYRQPMAMVRAASRVMRLAPSRDTDLGFRCARDGA